MSDQFSRSRMLLGDGPQERLFHASVALFGVGGVGGFCAEALARAGIGALDLYDDDTVSESNLNRQLIALHSTLGRPKAEVMAERVRDINPACRVRALRMFYLPENAGEVDLSRYDYVVDAVDTVSAKLELAVRCQALGVPLISAMGSGNKLDPSAFSVSDLSKTEGCPLARVMRKELRKRGIPEEAARRAIEETETDNTGIDAFVAAKLRGKTPDKKDLSRVAQMLLRRGHGWNDIKDALGRYERDLEE